MQFLNVQIVANFERLTKHVLIVGPTNKIMENSDRKFTLPDSNLIACDDPCDNEFTVEVEPSKSLTNFGNAPTLRCKARGSPLRGHQYGQPLESHTNPSACRVCTIYTAPVDKPLPQA